LGSQPEFDQCIGSSLFPNHTTYMQKYIMQSNHMGLRAPMALFHYTVPARLGSPLGSCKKKKKNERN